VQAEFWLYSRYKSIIQYELIAALSCCVSRDAIKSECGDKHTTTLAHIWYFRWFAYHVTFGHNVRPGHHSRMCFAPWDLCDVIPIISNFVWSISPFSMFLCDFQCCLLISDLCYINGLSMHSPYYSITYSTCFGPFDLLWPFVDFIYLLQLSHTG